MSMLLATVLSACTSVPLSTIWKLRSFDPLEANPSLIRIAVITDQAVQLKDNAVTLSLGFESEFPDYNFHNISHATVEPNASVEQLNDLVTDSQRITLFYLDSDNAYTMQLAQSRIRIIKQNDIEGSGSFSLGVNTGCFNGPKPDKLFATVFAQFHPEQQYLKMISSIDLLKQTAPGQDLWVECPNTESVISTP